MIRLCMQLLSVRKKWVLLLSFVLGLVIASMLSIFTATQTIKHSLLERSFEQYGQFIGVIHHLPDLDDAVSFDTSSAGHYAYIDSIQIKDHQYANVGWVDPTFIHLGRLHLVAGAFPSHHDEVALESYYHTAIDPTWNIGEYRTLSIGDESKTFQLTGIVENYSARWTVGQRNFKLPNVFLSKSFGESLHGQLSYFIPYDQDKSIQQNENFIHALIEEHGRYGFSNDRLFLIGLKDDGNTTKISFGFQLIILLLSSICVLSLVSFFYFAQRNKFFVFRALGCSYRRLYVISLIQITIVFVMGMLMSIPFFITIHYVILITTYGLDVFFYLTSRTILLSVIWVLLIYLVIAFLLYWEIARQSKRNIAANLKGDKPDFIFTSKQISGIKSFRIKQMFMQFFAAPRDTLFSIFTLTCCMVVLIFSFLIAEESKGLWTMDVDYYVEAQEWTVSKQISGKDVILSDIVVFDPMEVRKIQHTDGIKYVDKTPYMENVSAVFQTKHVSQELLSDVKYVLLNDQEFSRLYPQIDVDHMQDAIILHIPEIDREKAELLTGQPVRFTRTDLMKSWDFNTTHLDEDDIQEKSWDFNIAAVVDAPFQDGGVVQDGISMILHEQSALSKGITDGYRSFTIYTEDQLSEADEKRIYNEVYTVVAGIPGSLFQYLPILSHERTRITDFLDILGKITFINSIMISICAIYTLILHKYQVQKRYWGIYRALGLTTKSLNMYLSFELFVYFLVALLINGFFLTLYLVLNETTYPTMHYVQFAMITALTTFVMLFAASVFIKKKIKNDSIASLLRIDH